MAAILKSNMAAKYGQNDVYKRGWIQTLKMYPKIWLFVNYIGIILNAEEMSSKAGQCHACPAFEDISSAFKGKLKFSGFWGDFEV